MLEIYEIPILSLTVDSKQIMSLNECYSLQVQMPANGYIRVYPSTH